MVREPYLEPGVEHKFSAPADVVATLLDDRLLFDVDWQIPALALDENERLLRLARVKAILPPGNAIDEKATHDVTLENYIRLALNAAGDRQTLDTFLTHVQAVLDDGPEGSEALAQQVFWIWAPAAEIAGLYHHKTDLENAAFKRALPDEYTKIVGEYDHAVMDTLLGHMRDKIDVLLADVLDESVAYELSARPKSPYSVRQKLQNEDRHDTQLFDLLGFRVIIDGAEATAVEQCYVALSAVAAEFESEHSRLKDYITSPKPWGYQSLHLTLYTAAGLPFELQVRTRAMHNAAESDDALSHQTYAATFRETPGKIKRTFRTISKLYTWRNEATRLIREQDGRTEGVLGDDVLFFRDDGNLYRLPATANALDASFRIHNRRALRTKYIYRDGKLIGYEDPVRQGDVLHVEYWPNYPTSAAHFDRFSHAVRTKDARQAVEKGKRHALREEYRRLGRNTVLAMVGDIGLKDPFSVLDENDRRQLADRVGVPTFDNLLELVGARERSAKPTRIANWIKARCGLGEEVVIKPLPEKRGTLDNEAVLRDLLIPSSGGELDCQVAGCCTEKIKYGDDVLVRPSRVDGVLKVHLTDCVNIRDHSDTIICSWA